MKFKPVYSLIFLLFILHLPFISADPDKQVDVHTRGAWTDEGLYAAQSRNFVNYGNFDIRENTTFIRGPLFNILQVPFFYFFGTRLWVARLITIFFVLLAILVISSNSGNGWFGFFLIAFAFTHFRVFNFSHYAMAEMISISAILMSVICLDKYFEKQKIRFLVLSGLFIFISYSLKIQFAYAVLIIPLLVMVFGIFFKNNGQISRKRKIKDLTFAVSITILFALIYVLFWYLPNREFYDMVMFEQTGGKFDVWSRIHLTFRFNFDYYILQQENYPLIFGFLLAAILWILSFFVKKLQVKNHLVILFGLLWLGIEFHKLGLIHLPQRYLLGLYVSAGFFISAVLCQILPAKRWSVSIAIAIVCIVLAYNGYYNYEAFERRTYELKKVNEYVDQYNWKNKTIAGVWAPSVSWGTKARVIPVWEGYTKPSVLFGDDYPTAIVAEPNQGDSELFFENHGFDLDDLSDSSRYFNAWRYDFRFYWMRSPKESQNLHPGLD